VLHGTQIGQGVIIHSGVVIGSDGFGNALDHGRWYKVPQLGRVIIGDNVEIGANTTIDRGALEDTVIDEGVRLDNQIQIAHNVKVGAHTAMAGCVGVAGSTTIGKHCMIGGAVGISGHLEITDQVMVTGFTCVSKSITTPGIYSSGTGMMKNADWHRSIVRFKQLDELAKRVQYLEEKLKDKELL
jgi:UDP-3-O-[3-hydroxymyristoyl] glucosamine N-acyltransferase